MTKGVKIYTLGTSNRSLNEFLEILENYQIQTVIDVRRWPTSKWFEHFKKENLDMKKYEERFGQVEPAKEPKTGIGFKP